MLGSMETASMSCVGDYQHDKAALYLDGEAMTLARYPNKAADGTWRFLKADLAGKFGRPGTQAGGNWFLMKVGTNASKISGWITEDPGHAWLHGYWSFDWADCYRRLNASVPVTLNGTEYMNISFDATPNTEGAGAAIVKTHARFYGVNLLSELDEESEYFIDNHSLTLYFFPPGGANAADKWLDMASSPILAVNATALISVKKVAHVVLKDLTVAYGRGDGIEAASVTSFQVQNCSVFGLGRNGVGLSGVDSSVVDSSIHDCGCKGLSTVGGDGRTLRAGNLVIRNNRVHHVATWKRTYQAPISFEGEGG
jgi:hypothetical protein